MTLTSLAPQLLKAAGVFLLQTEAPEVRIRVTAVETAVQAGLQAHTLAAAVGAAVTLVTAALALPVPV
jgi:hypothetical protein